MNKKNLTLPFIPKNESQKEDLPFPAELACVVCLAEWQRKRVSLLRDTPEKLAFVSKVYYPLWLVAIENKCLLLDGLGLSTHKFIFKEPVKTGTFVENLRKNSINQQEFMSALDSETKKISEFTSPVNVAFKALIADKELLSFLENYLNNDYSRNKNEDEVNNLIPGEFTEAAVEETRKAYTNCLRTLQADAKGLQHALGVLKQEAEFHRGGLSAESEFLREKCEEETTLLRPTVDKAIKKLTQKHDKALSTVTKRNDQKIAVLENKREKYIRKLQAVEQRKNAVQRRISDARKKRKGGSGEYELSRCEKEIDIIKNEVNAVSDAIAKQKKQGDSNLKKLEEEFRLNVQQEENKITTLKNACDTRVAKKKQDTDTIASQTATIATSFGNYIDELMRSGSNMRQQVEVNWKLDSPDDAAMLHVPIYLMKYSKAKDERYSLITPLAISEEASLLNGLRKILTLSSEPKIKNLTRPASKKLQDMLDANVVERIQSDEVFKAAVTSVCRANNLLDRMEFAETLNEGLDEIVKRGWMTSEEASAACKRIMEAQP